MSKVVSGFLVVTGRGAMRVTSRRPKLRYDEIGFPLTVRIPDAWGNIQPSGLEVNLPEPGAGLPFTHVGSAEEPAE